MNQWESNFVASIKKQQAQGRQLSAKQSACLNKIIGKYGVGQAGLDALEGSGERELTWKQKYGQCEDAPCCGCCGSNVYGGY